jgi:Uma2 family endonuclease
MPADLDETPPVARPAAALSIYHGQMTTLAAGYREAIDRLPEGATLILHHVGWDDYERLVEDFADRPNLRLSYDRGRLEAMTPLAEHEAYARFIDDLARVLAEAQGLLLEKRGSTTWARQSLARGVEADACYYVANARQVIGKRTIDLDVDPPPDLVVEIDITNESLRKQPTYAALKVREIWRYDGETMSFHELMGSDYQPIAMSISFPGVTPKMLTEALAESRLAGQTAALIAFRQRVRRSPA